MEQLKQSVDTNLTEQVAQSSREIMQYANNLEERLAQLETVVLGKIDVPTMDSYLTRAR